MKKIFLCLLLFLSSLLCLRAAVNILIVGSDTPGNAGFKHSDPVPAFGYADFANELRRILEESARGEINIVTEERFREASTVLDIQATATNLASWFFWPYPAEVETTERWPNLRGERGTEWDYVIVIGDPYTIETTPGLFTFGVAEIAKEVAKGGAQTVLLMPWPAEDSASSVTHYREVVYRTGRSAGLMVIPAGLAWSGAGAPTGSTHPSKEGAYIAAAATYSRLFGESAARSLYRYNDRLADSAYDTVKANVHQPQFKGAFDFNNPYAMLGDKRREIRFSHKGTSTERGFMRALWSTLDSLNLSYEKSPLDGKYNSATPLDDDLGWPEDAPLPIAFNHGRHPRWVRDGHKSYETNQDIWQLGFGFVYQRRTKSFPVEDSTNHFVSLMRNFDQQMADDISQGILEYHEDPGPAADERASARAVPVRALWAMIAKAYPEKYYQRDRTHLIYGLDKAVSSFIYTLYSGRTPIDAESSDPKFADEPEFDLFCQRVGYEMAWRLGRLQARVPGFQVKPASSEPTLSKETMTVRFFYPPEAAVRVSVSVSDPRLATVQPKELIFTPDNYAEAQRVVVNAPEANGDSDRTVSIHYQTSSSDPVFDNLSDAWEFVLERGKGAIPK